MPHAEFIGDLGDATTAIRIGDPGALQVLAKNSDPCNFRLFQQYPPIAAHRKSDVKALRSDGIDRLEMAGITGS